MPVSQNGWSANDRSVITTYTIGNGRRVALRNGAAGAMLCHLANWFDAAIKDIDAGILDDWGYAERPIRGGVELSNHASGTALDIDATKWPLGVEPSSYLTADQIARVRRQLLVYQGCIRWGGDYTGRKDPMHFEINKDQATVERVWKEIISRTVGETEREEIDMVLFRNTEGTVILVGGNFAVWVPDTVTHKNLLTAGIKMVQVGDAFFNAIVKQTAPAS